MEQYIQDMVRTFAFFGFPQMPLTEPQLRRCYARKLSKDTTYNVGCDVAAGIPFHEALAINK